MSESGRNENETAWNESGGYKPGENKTGTPEPGRPGRLVVLEGVDGSGKSTQYRLLRDALTENGYDFRCVAFPRYEQESSALIRAYLAGDYGTAPGDVNPYAASTFYAVDRFASYRTDWGAYYAAGGLVLCDRYTTSNACHQGSKLAGAEREAYFRWLAEFEYRLMGLPAPSLVLYLDVEPEISLRQLERRSAETHVAPDIHERDAAYLAACLEAGRHAAAFFGWRRIACAHGGEMRPPEDIHAELWQAVRETLR